jgi:hypothetical protein
VSPLRVVDLLAVYFLSGTLSAFVSRRTTETLALILPGFIFGLLIGALYLGTVGHILAYAAISAAAYYSAALLAIRTYKNRSLPVAGLLGGGVGAFSLFLALTFLGGYDLNLIGCVSAVVLGGLIGIVFIVISVADSKEGFHEWPLLVLAFFLWQSAVGLVIDSYISGNTDKAIFARGWPEYASRPLVLLVPLIISIVELMRLSPPMRHDEGVPAVTQRASYRDLPTALTRHTWLALSYALVSICLIYALGLWPSASLMFFAFLIPTLGAIIYVTSGNPVLWVRLPIAWLLTNLIVWTYNMDSDAMPWAVNALWVGVILVVTYWLTVAVSSSAAEFRQSRRLQSVTAAFAWLFSAWGATLQIAFIALLVIKYALGDAPRSSAGASLVWVLHVIRLTSPVVWLPSGVFAVGIIIFAVFLFGDFPYKAADFKDVLPIDLPPVISEIASMIRIPIWLLAIIFGFLGHFTKLIGKALLWFGDRWLGRFILSTMGLVVPILTLIAGHHAIFCAMASISASISARSGSMWGSLAVFLVAHLLILWALFMYVVSLAPLGIDVFPVSARKAISYVSEYLHEEGFVVAEAVGKAFALYGIIFIAVPVAALLPGGGGWGIFSLCYLGIICIFALFYLLKAIPRKR